MTEAIFVRPAAHGDIEAIADEVTRAAEHQVIPSLAAGTELRSALGFRRQGGLHASNRGEEAGQVIPCGGDQNIEID